MKRTMERSGHDLIVIGGGSAGHAAASTAAELGLRCAVVESADELGGLCILRGCMPSKALIETANRMRDIRGAGDFAIEVPPPRLDPEKLRERVRGLVRDFRDSRVEEMRSGKYELVRGSCRFVSPHAVEVEESGGTKRVMEASAFVIATGSAPSVPDIPGLAGTPFWTSDDVVGLPRVPERLAVIGGGAIGMECAHLFEGLGSRVTVVIRSGRILKGFDPEVSSALEAESRRRGIGILKDTRLTRVEHDGAGFLLHHGGDGPLACDALLVATGRKPRTGGLGLDVLGLAMDGPRILIDDRATTSLPHVFAAGDCASPVPVVHLGVIQGEVAARNAAMFLRGDHSESAATWNRDGAMIALFTEPQVVSVGIDGNTAEERGLDPVCGKQDYADHGKGLIAGVKHGFVKVVAAGADGRLIGATAVGPQVAESGHLPAFAIERGLSVSDYLALPHYHPTFAEAWSRAVEETGIAG